MVPRPPSDLDRDLFALPVRFGGLGVCIPADVCNQQYQFSKELLHGMVAFFLDQQSLLPSEVVHYQNELFKHLTTLKNQSLSDHSRSVVSRCPFHLCWAVECCQEKGACSWLLALPFDQYGFSLNKGEFVDALCLRYGFAPPNLPSHTVCVPQAHYVHW